MMMGHAENLFVLLVGMSAFALILALGGAIQEYLEVSRLRRQHRRMARLLERLK